ncbi:hypothetical protein HDV57DRAFT_516607 [Trichoderma longibrachiatum]
MSKDSVLQHPAAGRGQREEGLLNAVQVLVDNFPVGHIVRHWHWSYDGIIDDKLPAEIPPEQYLIHCKHLVEGVFRIIDMNHEDYPDCYAACVEKAVNTKILNVRNWSSWGGGGGYRHFRELVIDAAAYISETNEVHLPNTPSMVAAMAIRKLRCFEPSKDDDLVIDYKMFDHPCSQRLFKA